MAGSATVGILRVLLTSNTAEFETGMKRVSSAMGALSKDLGAMGRQATQIGTALTRTLTVPLLGLGVGAAKMAMDFESSFAGVRKTVDATEPEFAQMAQAFRNLSKEIPVNVNELNRLGEAAGALGIPKAEVVDFARVMALLGVTTNVTADQAAEAVAKIQNIFGAAGQDTERFASTLVALGNAGASTEAQILEMATRIAGAGRVVGLTQGQVLAFGSALSSLGLEAEAGGSAISRTFLTINDAVMSGGGALTEFARIAGMSATQFKEAFERDAAGATTAFIAGLGRIHGEGENVNQTLKGLELGEIRVRDALLRAAGGSDLFTSALQLQSQAWTVNSALTNEAAERFKTTESQLTLLWNRIKDVGITLGNALLPTINLMVKMLGDLIPVIDALARGFNAMPAPVQALVVGLGLAAAAVGPLIWGFGQLLIAAQAVTGAFAAKGLAMRALQPLIAVYTTQMTAAAGATTVLRTSMVGLIGIAGGVVTAFGSIAVAWASFKNDWTRSFDVLIPPLGMIRAGIDAWKSSTAAATPVTKASGEAFKMMASHGEAVNTVIQQMPPMLRTATESVDRLTQSTTRAGTATATAAKQVRDSTLLVSRSIAEAGQATATADLAMQHWAMTMGGVLMPALQDAGRELQNLAAGLEANGNLVSESALIWAQYPPAVKSAMGESAEGVRSFGTAVAEIMGNLPNVIMGAIQGGGDVLRAVGSHIGVTLAQSVVKHFGEFFSGALGSMLGGLLPILGSLLGPLLSKVGNWFRDLFGGIPKDVQQARAEVEAFQAALRATLTDTQRAEAGTEDWKKDVIAVRDAFLAVGRSEAEALAIVKQLWDTDHPDRARAAMELINQVLEEAKRKSTAAAQGVDQIAESGEQAKDAIELIRDAINRIPNEKRIKVGVDFDDSGLPRDFQPGDNRTQPVGPRESLLQSALAGLQPTVISPQSFGAIRGAVTPAPTFATNAMAQAPDSNVVADTLRLVRDIMNEHRNVIALAVRDAVQGAV